MIKNILRSIWIWTGTLALLMIWLPLMAIVRLFDRDPVRYATGRMYRRLARPLASLNPYWRIHVSGQLPPNPRRPHVVVSNHQSQADVPLVSLIGWEMKWIAKAELFRVPFIGWMLSLAGDIRLERGDRRKGAAAMLQALRMLENKCPVMIFPEGTRSPDGRVQAFTDGAFHLAIKAQVPVLPLALDGSHGCLPKKSWIFGETQDIYLKALPEVDTAGMTSRDIPRLRDEVRGMIIRQVAEWRGCPPEEVDMLTSS